MNALAMDIRDYRKYCKTQKKLSRNTLRAYKIDMDQFLSFLLTHYADIQTAQDISKNVLKDYVQRLVEKYAIRTCKRKIACIKAFFNHLEFEDIIPVNPFRKIRLQMKEPKSLPKTMCKDEVQKQFSFVYQRLHEAVTPYQVFCAKRDIACYELLFSTGMRVGELCSLSREAIDFEIGSIRIWGKGSKERIVYITSNETLAALKFYDEVRTQRPHSSSSFFIGWKGSPLREDAVRRTVKRIAQLTVHRRVTPHMFRHTFATMLLENLVDIRFIQEILGHSSIKTTQIYLHLSNAAVRAALEKGHLRERLEIGDTWGSPERV